ISQRLEEFQKASAAALSLADQIAAGGKEVDRTAFLAAVDHASEALSQLSQATAAEIDHLIQQRLDNSIRSGLLAAALSAGALLLAVLLAWLVASNLTGRLRELADAAQA